MHRRVASARSGEGLPGRAAPLRTEGARRSDGGGDADGARRCGPCGSRSRHLGIKSVRRAVSGRVELWRGIPFWLLRSPVPSDAGTTVRPAATAEDPIVGTRVGTRLGPSRARPPLGDGPMPTTQPSESRPILGVDRCRNKALTRAIVRRTSLRIGLRLFAWLQPWLPVAGPRGDCRTESQQHWPQADTLPPVVAAVQRSSSIRLPHTFM